MNEKTDSVTAVATAFIEGRKSALLEALLRCASTKVDPFDEIAAMVAEEFNISIPKVN